jgi:hypothetical protein
MADAPGSTSPTIPRPFLEFRPLLRAPGIASDARKLILAAIGLLALHAGWLALSYLFAGSGSSYDPSLPGSTMLEEPFEASSEGLLDAALESLLDVADELIEPFRTLASPVSALFVTGIGPARWFRSALMAIWAAVVWGIAGGAIARIAVVQAAVDRRIGLGSALRFSLGKWSSLIGAPLTPMLAVAILAGCCALFGLIYRIPAGIGGFLATILGFVPLMLGLVMALVLIGLALGWPLMHATIAAESEDAPDALSRSYSYINQRLARYLAHAIAALLIGSVGLIAVMAFARAVLTLAEWGVSLGAPNLDNLDNWIKNGRLFWAHTVGLLVLAWTYSYFWSAASVIYLILRRDVDGTAWHDVYLPERAADTFASEPSTETTLMGSAPAESVAP